MSKNVGDLSYNFTKFVNEHSPEFLVDLNKKACDWGVKYLEPVSCEAVGEVYNANHSIPSKKQGLER